MSLMPYTGHGLAMPKRCPRVSTRNWGSWASVSTFWCITIAYRHLKCLLSWSNGTAELYWYGSTLFLAAITNIEAGDIATPNSMEWLVFVIMAAGIQKEYQEMRQQQEGRDRLSMNLC